MAAAVYLQYCTDNSFGTSTTCRLIGGGRIMGGRLIGIRLYFRSHFYCCFVFTLEDVIAKDEITERMI